MHYKIPYNLKNILETCKDLKTKSWYDETYKSHFIRDDDPTIAFITITSLIDPVFTICYKFKDDFLVEIVDEKFVMDHLYKEIE
jgi:hypothetical protein